MSVTSCLCCSAASADCFGTDELLAWLSILQYLVALDMSYPLLCPWYPMRVGNLRGGNLYFSGPWQEIVGRKWTIICGDLAEWGFIWMLSGHKDVGGISISVLWRQRRLLLLQRDEKRTDWVSKNFICIRAHWKISFASVSDGNIPEMSHFPASNFSLIMEYLPNSELPWQ